MSTARLLRYSAELAILAFVVAVLFGCTDAQLDAANKRLVAAETVAYSACKARQDQPVVASALREAAASVVPGASTMQGVISASCSVLLANPGTTVTFTTGGQPR